MGLLSDVFIAAPNSAFTFSHIQELPTTDVLRLKYISPLQTAQWLAVLRGDLYSVELIREFQLVTPEDADEWTTRIPHDMVTRLAAITDEQVPAMAKKFSDATHEELAWSAADYSPIVTELAELARRALAASKTLYLWNSL